MREYVKWSAIIALLLALFAWVLSEIFKFSTPVELAQIFFFGLLRGAIAWGLPPRQPNWWPAIIGVTAAVAMAVILLLAWEQEGKNKK